MGSHWYTVSSLLSIRLRYETTDESSTDRIQNSVNDLFSIFRFLGGRVVPGQLWERPTFDAQIGKPIKSKQNKLAFERLSVSYLHLPRLNPSTNPSLFSGRFGSRYASSHKEHDCQRQAHSTST